MYKCCWNCDNGYPIAHKYKEEGERINASKRVCMACYPVSNRLENPFKQRYCKQFYPDYRAQLTEELRNIYYPLPTSWAFLKGTKECPLPKGE